MQNELELYIYMYIVWQSAKLEGTISWELRWVLTKTKTNMTAFSQRAFGHLAKNKFIKL